MNRLTRLSTKKSESKRRQSVHQCKNSTSTSIPHPVDDSKAVANSDASKDDHHIQVLDKDVAEVHPERRGRRFSLASQGSLKRLFSWKSRLGD